jgi:hypothetical protein
MQFGGGGGGVDMISYLKLGKHRLISHDGVSKATLITRMNLVTVSHTAGLIQEDSNLDSKM